MCVLRLFSIEYKTTEEEKRKKSRPKERPKKMQKNAKKNLKTQHASKICTFLSSLFTTTSNTI